MRSENRKYVRFLVQDKVYAALGVHFHRVGKIIDISIGGLAFEYIENQNGCVQNPLRLTVFHSENGFYLPNLTCMLIYDQPKRVMNKKLKTREIYAVKRCGVQFTAMTANQEREIEFLLNRYTSGLVPGPKDINFA